MFEERLKEHAGNDPYWRDVVNAGLTASKVLTNNELDALAKATGKDSFYHPLKAWEGMRVELALRAMEAKSGVKLRDWRPKATKKRDTSIRRFCLLFVYKMWMMHMRAEKKKYAYGGTFFRDTNAVYGDGPMDGAKRLRIE